MSVSTKFTRKISISDDSGLATTPYERSFELDYLGGGFQFVPDLFIGVAPPVAPSPTPSAGGSMGAGNYLFFYTYVSAPQGETTAGAESTPVSVPSSGKVTFGGPTQSGSARYYNVYGTQAGGSTGSETKINSSPILIGNPYVHTAAITGSGSAVPGSNTTLIYTPTLLAIPVRELYILNFGGGNMNVQWQKQGAGSLVDVQDLGPNGDISVAATANPTGAGGIIALQLTVDAVLTKLHMELISQ